MNDEILIWILVLVMNKDLSEHKVTHTRAECISIGRMIMADEETPFDGFFCDPVGREPLTEVREIPKCRAPARECS